ncbi:hypothetical protein M408DRAFT_30702 [Serendipita vermifera MAFF 305830]|uniref:Uncharacterized protein n=1 Tax=Serendipita vermifera MAFF 305830 TaxID=933852 RepID=A0A0C3A5V7_SERVB|nr:hypothetical protein M408DRAFT_30702 [Serendipita vermifera MAFF 305830]
MHLNVTEAAAIAVLSHWYQVRHLVLDLTNEDCFTWEGAFAKRLKSSENPLCPNLITLTLRTWWSKDKSDRWLPSARAMFKARSLGPLEFVSWVHSRQKTKVIITREDIDITDQDVGSRDD